MANDIRPDIRPELHPGPVNRLGPEPRLTEIISGIVDDAQELVKQQLALFKTEVKDDIRKTKEAAIALASGLAVGAVGILFLLLAVVHLLAWAFPAMPLWCCYGLVGVVLAAAGGVLVWEGKRRFESFNPLPEQSAEALKENVQWFM